MKNFDQNKKKRNTGKNAGLESGTGRKVIRVSGQIMENLPSVHFRVKLDDGKEIIAHLAGKLRIHRIKILPGDKVTVEMSSYGDTRGRIVYRGK